MRLFLLIILSMLVADFAVAQAPSEPNDQSGDIRYISDNLYTFMHSGPGRNYRILGSVEAGSRITQLQISDDGEYIEIIDDRQRTGWVEADVVSLEASFRTAIPRLETELAQAKEQSSRDALEIDQLNQQLLDLRSRSAQLEQKITSLETDNARVNGLLSAQDQSAQIEWFTRGGIVALVGLIIGVLLTFLPKKRRRNDGWV